MASKKYNVEVVLVRSYNITAKIIHVGMFLWYVLRFKKPKYCYNHAEIKYGDMTSGAISEGVKSRNFEQYLKDLGKYKLKKYTVELTKKEYERGMEYIKEAENTDYEFKNFFYHALKIFTDNWYGSTDSSELYCYEHVIRFLNESTKYYFNPFLNPVEAEKLFDIKLK